VERAQGPWARRQEGKGGRADFGKGGEFVGRVLELAKEQLEQRTRLLANGPGDGTNHATGVMANRNGIPVEEVRGNSKVRKAVRVRAMFCYLAVGKLGYSVAAAAPRPRGASPATDPSGSQQGGGQGVTDPVQYPGGDPPGELLIFHGRAQKFRLNQRFKSDELKRAA
jgi:hypothetical protein